MKIDVPFKKLRHVVHAADFHIRLLRRHDEYTNVFNQFYADIRNRKLEDFVIVLAGDIVHAKTDLSPELVDLTSQFLSNLSDIAPTILIAGNHDCNLRNSSRLDALSPIVNAINHPNLHYVKNSDVVYIADSAFAVHSIFSSKDEWPVAANIDNKYTKIALYHGPVNGSLTDVNFVVTDRHVTTDVFDGYEIVMLGDIHKPNQKLQDYSKTDGKPIVVYPGSFTQQNFGETAEDHGWCLWNIKDRSYEFVPVENDYGYLTLEVQNGKIKHPKNAPKNVRMRLFTGEMEATDVKKLVTMLREKYNIIELSVNKNKTTTFDADRAKLSHTGILDVSDINFQSSLIQNWIKTKYPTVTDDTLKKIDDINQDLNSKIKHDDQSRNIRWKPLKFRFSNMFSYGENNEIDFENMTGTYGLFAANASGKSSLISSIMFCLYDKAPQATKGSHIINNRKDTFECELLFEINGELYGIRRVGSRKKTGDVRVDVDFWKTLPDGSTVSLNGEDRRGTNANIKSYVGSYDDFVITAFSNHDTSSMFIDKTHSERKDLLIQFMGLNIFDELHDIASDESREIIGVLKRFKNSDIEISLSTAKSTLDIISSDLDNLEDTLKSRNNEKSSLENTLASLRSEKEDITLNYGDIDSLSKAKTNLVNDIQNCNNAAQELKMTKEANERKRVETQEQLDGVDIDKLTISNKLYTEQIPIYQKKKDELVLIKSKIEEKESLKNTLLEYKYNPECDICVENNKSIIEKLEKVNADLDKLNSASSALIVEMSEMKDNLMTLKTDHENYEVAMSYQTKIESLDRTIADLSAKENALLLKEMQCKVSLDKVTHEIEEYELNATNILRNKELDKRIDIVTNSAKSKAREIDQLTERIKELTGKRAVFEHKKQDLLDKIQEAADMEFLYDAYTKYLEATDRDGVPYELIGKTIPQIENEVNTILSNVVDFTVTLEVDTKNITSQIVYGYDRHWPIENSSGMERFISGLAIRIALMNASNLPKPNFMVVDEGFSALDSEHIHGMHRLFDLLRANFEFVVVISHIDTMRDMVDTILDIKKDDGFSFISA